VGKLPNTKKLFLRTVHRPNIKIATILQIFVIISWILALKVIGIFLHRSMKKNACDVLAGTIKRLAATASIQCVSEAIIDSVYKLFVWAQKNIPEVSFG
jgi:hypothetical protein